MLTESSRPPALKKIIPLTRLIVIVKVIVSECKSKEVVSVRLEAASRRFIVSNSQQQLACNTVLLYIVRVGKSNYLLLRREERLRKKPNNT